MVNANKRADEKGPSSAPYARRDPQRTLRVRLRSLLRVRRETWAFLIGPYVIVSFLSTACTTYREAKPAVAAEPPKVYEQKTPDDMRDQEAIPADGESAEDAEAEKKKQKQAADGSASQ